MILVTFWTQIDVYWAFINSVLFAFTTSWSGLLIFFCEYFSIYMQEYFLCSIYHVLHNINNYMLIWVVIYGFCLKEINWSPAISAMPSAGTTSSNFSINCSDPYKSLLLLPIRSMTCLSMIPVILAGDVVREPSSSGLSTGYMINKRMYSCLYTWYKDHRLTHQQIEITGTLTTVLPVESTLAVHAPLYCWLPNLTSINL